METIENENNKMEVEITDNNIPQEENLQTPLQNENIQVEEVTEGKASVRLCNDDKSFFAFYNPAQEFNRDLSVISINTIFKFNKYRKEKETKLLKESKFSICECLSATGLRAIRYYLELDRENIKEIVANDMDKKAVDCIYNNLKKNGIEDAENIFKTYQSEASQLLYSKMKYYDIIDLDPYGSAIPMIDSSLQSLKSGGLLCVTFTDMPVLCGNYPETTFYKYGSISYKTPFCHEMAKRIALFSISSAASKYKKVIKPLLSFNAEFYIRLFLIVKDSPEDCKNNGLKYGYMHHCRNCQNRYITPLAHMEESKNIKKDKTTSRFKFNNLTGNTICEICESHMCLNGPFWTDNIHDEDFIDTLLSELDTEHFSYLKYNKRIKTYLNGIKEELPLNNQVFSFDYSRFASDVSVSSPKLNLFKGALESLGFKMAQTYYDPNLFKTDANASVIYDIFKKYKKDNYGPDDFFKNVKEESYKYKILEKEIKVNPVFVESTTELKSKFPQKPFKNWGPKARAKEVKKDDDGENKKGKKNKKEQKKGNKSNQK